MSTSELPYAMAPAQRRSSLIQSYYPSLDGLRALALLLVFTYHYSAFVEHSRFLSRNAIWKWGWCGVDIFFVLSGFLITGILVDSLTDPRFFRNFYIRRSLRIFPLFYGLWVVLLLLTPVLHIAWNRYNFATMAYVGNLFIPGAILGDHPDGFLVYFRSFTHPGDERTIMLGHFWSLCVEEQFYLLWPAVVFLVRSRRFLLNLCLAVVVISPFLRGLYVHLFPQMLAAYALYDPTLPRVDTLLAGGALALWLRNCDVTADRLRQLGWALALGAPLLLATLWRLEPTHSVDTNLDPMVSVVGFSLIAAMSVGLLLLTIHPATVLARLLRLRPLKSLGRISYGMYFFHMIPWLFWMQQAIWMNAHHLGFLILVAPFVSTLVVAQLSFRYFEIPFLRLKSVLAPTVAHRVPYPPSEASVQ